MLNPLPGPVLSCSPGPSGERLPTVCTHGGLGGLEEMGIKPLHCMRVTCSQCSLPGLGTAIHEKMSKAAESREASQWSLLPSCSSATLGHLQMCGLVGSPGGRAGVPLNKGIIADSSLLTPSPLVPLTHTTHTQVCIHAHTRSHTHVRPCTQTQHAQVHVHTYKHTTHMHAHTCSRAHTQAPVLTSPLSAGSIWSAA